MAGHGRLGTWLLTLARLALAAAMGIAGASKLGDPAAVRLAVAGYGILPPALVPPVAAVLPWLELALAVYLAAGLYGRAAAVATGLLLLAFEVALAVGWAHHVTAPCGCFGTGGAPPGPGDMIRDAVLLGLATWVAVAGPGPWSLDGWRGADPGRRSLRRPGED